MSNITIKDDVLGGVNGNWTIVGLTVDDTSAMTLVIAGVVLTLRVYTLIPTLSQTSPGTNSSGAYRVLLDKNLSPSIVMSVGFTPDASVYSRFPPSIIVSKLISSLSQSTDPYGVVSHVTE